ncbi:hypothetical protein ACM66B_005376 [Microbotryomycetes sp. NB124-2]
MCRWAKSKSDDTLDSSGKSHASSRRGSDASSSGGSFEAIQTENSVVAAAPEPRAKRPVSPAPPPLIANNELDHATMANIRALALVPPAVAACAAAAAASTAAAVARASSITPAALPLPMVAASAAAAVGASQHVTRPGSTNQVPLHQPTPVHAAPKSLDLDTATLHATSASPPLGPAPLNHFAPTLAVETKSDLVSAPTRGSSRSTGSMTEELATPSSPSHSIFAGMSPVSYAHSLDPVSPPWPSVDATFGEFALMSCGVDELLASAPALFPPVIPPLATNATTGPATKANGGMFDSSLAHFAA